MPGDKTLWQRLGIVAALGAAAIVGQELIKSPDIPDIKPDFNAAASATIQTHCAPAYAVKPVVQVSAPQAFCRN